VFRERLHLRFESPESLRSEFEKNIANGGLFVATDEPYQIRQPVTVEIALVYLEGSGGADCPGGVLELDGEIVHVVPLEMASSGVVPGVALQLEESPQDLRERFTPLIGKRAVSSVEKDLEGPRRRGARRHSVRVPVRVMPVMSPPFEATSRDLSATGILLSLRDTVLPVGEVVRICLWHPSGDPSVVVDGKVVREVPNKKGRIAAVAVAFDRNQAADMRVRGVIDALREAGHRSRLGGISGSIGDLGLPSLLQMFGASAPQGTLVVECDGEQGWIAFADGQLLGAEMGLFSGHDALVAMLDWSNGSFEFEANADPQLVESAPRKPLEGAVLAAVCAIDERDAEAGPGFEVVEADETIIFEADAVPGLSFPDALGDDAGEDGEDDDGFGTASPVVEITSATTFEIDREQEELSVGTLDKTEEALIDLARAGMTRARMSEIIPEAEERIQAALEGLVDLGVLLPR
jgi:Tfp pilus assembly protein PilZ